MDALGDEIRINNSQEATPIPNKETPGFNAERAIEGPDENNDDDVTV